MSVAPTIQRVPESQKSASAIDEASVLSDLESMTYAEVAERHGVSRGRVYSIAVANQARKHERRIQERHRERKELQKSYLREVINATVKADVLSYLDGLPSGSIDLHLTSVPYNQGVAYSGSTSADSRQYHYYLGFLLQVLSEITRTLSDGGVLFLNSGSTIGPNGTLLPIDVALFEHLESMGLVFQNRIIWEVCHGLTPRRRLAERYETALVFSRGPQPRIFNPTPGRTPALNPGKRAYKGPRKGQLSGHPLGAWPTNVWRIPSVRANHPERTGHPAQFPEELARKAVLLYTSPESTVCDVFVGSGTSAAVCKKTGRAFTGCDLSYERMREKRLAAVVPDLVSLLPGVSDQSLAIWQAEADPVSFPAAVQSA